MCYAYVSTECALLTSPSEKHTVPLLMNHSNPNTWIEESVAVIE